MESPNAMVVGEKIVDLIRRAPAGGIFNDATTGLVAISPGHIGMNSTVDFRLDVPGTDGFVVRVEPLWRGK
jgi:hypothetical protein